MTIARAREILGRKAENLSDNQVESIIVMLYNLSTKTIEAYKKERYETYRTKTNN
ncbi:MAG: hypothetical protein RI947_1462 [Candidatus Parcubacteria bacterium]|jgi:uncharacterized membrane protein YgcG